MAQRISQPMSSAVLLKDTHLTLQPAPKMAKMSVCFKLDYLFFLIALEYPLTFVVIIANLYYLCST